MKKNILITIFISILLVTNVKAACQADVDMGSAKIVNMRFSHKSASSFTVGGQSGNIITTNAGEIAATRSYVDGMLKPIRLYWFGGDPLENTFSTDGHVEFDNNNPKIYSVEDINAPTISFSVVEYEATDKDNIVRSLIYAYLSSGYPRTYHVGYDSGGDEIWIKKENSFFCYKISGIKYKKNFTISFDATNSFDSLTITFKNKTFTEGISVFDGYFVHFDYYNKKIHYEESDYSGMTSLDFSVAKSAADYLHGEEFDNIVSDYKYHNYKIHYIEREDSAAENSIPVISIYIDGYHIITYKFDRIKNDDCGDPAFTKCTGDLVCFGSGYYAHNHIKIKNIMIDSSTRY